MGVAVLEGGEGAASNPHGVMGARLGQGLKGQAHRVRRSKVGGHKLLTGVRLTTVGTLKLGLIILCT